MELAAVLRLLVALAVVLGLLALLAAAAKRFNLIKPVSQTGRRLAVVETIALDQRRRLVLVRRDGVEHLLVLGQEGATLVEAGIAGMAPNALPAGPAQA